jgi:anti-anti-sigma factor
LKSTDSQAIELPGSLDIRTAPELKESLIAMLAASPDLRVVGNGVGIATTPGLQLLMAAASSAEKQGGRLVLVDPSPALCAAFTDIGCGSLITDWSKADG